jgi:hypothetical protein
MTADHSHGSDHRPAVPTEVARFLRDPLYYRRQDIPPVATAEVELGGSHLLHVADAQAHALHGHHAEAADAMQRALDILAPAQTTLEMPADRLHRKLLVALARTFVAIQRALSGTAPAGPSAEIDLAVRERPDIAYLHLQRAWLHRREGAAEAALTAIERANAVAGTESNLIYARAAALAVLDSGASEALLERVEQRFLAPPATGGRRKRDVEHSRVLAYWRGRIALARAERLRASNRADKAVTPSEAAVAALGEASADQDELDGPADAQEQEELSRAALAQARDLAALDKTDKAVTAAVVALEEAAAEKDELGRAAEGRLAQARDLAAVCALRNGRTGPAAQLLSGQGDAAGGKALGIDGGAFTWRALAQAVADAALPDGRLLQHAVELLRTDWITSRAQPPAGHRIVVELPEDLMPDAAAYRLIIGKPDDQAKRELTTEALRRRVKYRYGIRLPTMFYRPVTFHGRIPRSFAIALDGIVLATMPAPLPKQRLVMVPRPAAPRQTVASSAGLEWFGRDVLPASDGPGLAPSLLVNVFALKHLLRCLDACLGSDEFERLGLTSAPPAPVITMLRILAAERTPLTQKDALRALMPTATDPDSAVEAAERYRQLPGVRRLLWGAGVGFVDLPLPEVLEAALAAGLVRAGGAASLDDMLARRIEAWLHATLPAQGHCRVVLRRAWLRPWTRVLLRPRWPDLPTLSRAELDPP